MIRSLLTPAVLASAMIVSACGDSQDDAVVQFETKSAAVCVEANGEAATPFCACTARLFNEMLNDKDKRYLVNFIFDDTLSPEEAHERAMASGYTLADISAFGKKLVAVGQRSDKECPPK